MPPAGMQHKADLLSPLLAVQALLILRLGCLGPQLVRRTTSPPARAPQTLSRVRRALSAADPMRVGLQD